MFIVFNRTLQVAWPQRSSVRSRTLAGFTDLSLQPPGVFEHGERTVSALNTFRPVTACRPPPLHYHHHDHHPTRPLCSGSALSSASTPAFETNVRQAKYHNYCSDQKFQLKIRFCLISTLYKRFLWFYSWKSFQYSPL